VKIEKDKFGCENTLFALSLSSAGKHFSDGRGQEGSRLPITDCTLSSINFQVVQAECNRDVTVIFERLYLVPGLTPIFTPSQLSLNAHTPTAHLPAIS